MKATKIFEKMHEGIFEDISVKLGLIYSAFFGFKVLHKPELYTRFGQVKDDVERNARRRSSI